ncbi:MAG: hydroxymethylglutaryl-CoA reductase, degradative [Bacteroides sp.]|nr:hydroxymethylglutaryl-CoA reductase, degradative [Bacteroides sp.]
MTDPQIVKGFSKLSRTEKLEWLKAQSALSLETMALFNSHLHSDPKLQDIYGDISENSISNFFLPMGLAPNFLINDELMTLPMVIEESSVVAAASHAAKFWAMNGGFHAEVKGLLKVGQVHFTWSGKKDQLLSAFISLKADLFASVSFLTARMEKRGGGIESMEIRESSEKLPGAYQLFVNFHTADAMGGNFINSVLEELARVFKSMMGTAFPEDPVEIIMAILSNYTPQCLVSCELSCEFSAFKELSGGKSGREFAEKLCRAVEIAEHDPYRAVTHNKGIFNGMDAVLMATGNDYRAVEACGHAYASAKGSYSSLSHATCSDNTFSLTLQIPLALGTVGGLTSTHPMAASAMQILGNPSSEKLMQIVAAAGLASNFSALRSLITTGIQQGHMKMHLGNILRQVGTTPDEAALVKKEFAGRTISHAEVENFLFSIRKQSKEL